MTEKGLEPTEFVEDDLYRVKEGKLVKLLRPNSGFGKHIIFYQNDKIQFIETSYTEK